MSPSSLHSMPSIHNKPQIIDVRIADEAHGSHGYGIREQILDGLRKPPGSKSIPTMLLYDERGLRLYDAIATDCKEYYLFASEEEILKSNSDAIVQLMHARDGEASEVANPVILELGAGSLRKTTHILLALSRLASSSDQTTAKNDEKRITYYALDLEKRELERTLTGLMSTYGNDLEGKVEVKGMWGTYDGGLKLVYEGGLSSRAECEVAHDYLSHGADSSCDRQARKSHRDVSPRLAYSNSRSSHSRSTGATSLAPPSSPGTDDGSKLSSPPLHLLFLGSSLGNFDRESAVSFLRSLPLRPGSGDTLLLGLDHDNGKLKVEEAYNDAKGVSKNFAMNGLRVAGKTVGNEILFDSGKWEYVNRYNEAERCREAYYKSTCDQKLQVPESADIISFLAGELVKFSISQKYSDKDAYPLFTSAELRPIMRWTDAPGQYSLWLLERPTFTFPLLKSPKPFCVPTLEDFRTMWKAWDTITFGMIPRSMLFTKPTDLRHIYLFYLGHIPAFLDIHLTRLLGEAHSERESFKNYFEREIDAHIDNPSTCHPHSEVPDDAGEWPTLESIINFRERVRARLARLYGDIASGKRQLTRKVARVLLMTLEHEGFHVETLLYMLMQGAGAPGGTLPPPGFTAPPWDILAERWNSIPPPVEPTVTLGPADVILGHGDPEALDDNLEVRFQDDNVEFGWDNEHPARKVLVETFRIEWRPVTNGDFYEFFKGDGKEKVKLPASWIEINGETRVRTLYGPIPMKFAQHWPVLTSYDDISKYAGVKGGRLPTEAELLLFSDRFESGYEGDGNVGFRNWHPVPVTTGGEKDTGKGHNGGVWEWTSTVFDINDGFIPSKLYPGCSGECVDEKRRVIAGGSYATIPHLSGRRMLRNYYQHNYPYPWVAGRVAYDL
ncbi:DUF323 domain-containing protein [Phellopilus nigrolimitatus]|nr:DUF323 domain-containing protein [Phellopilus nigrolimitatus]